VQPPKLKDSDTVELLPIIKPQRNVISDDESDEEDRTFFSKKAKNMDGMAKFLKHFEKTPPPKRKIESTPKLTKLENRKKKLKSNEQKLKPLIEEYRTYQKESNGECNNMNCYNTLFVGRLAYETTERKLLREFEVFGPIKDLKLVFDKDKQSKSKGYAFVEYEHEEDMKRAYRAADAMKLDGKEIVVDVERGHTVPNWLPRRLNGGLGGTRLGGVDRNVTLPGRFDPSKQSVSAAIKQQQQRQEMMRGGPPPGPYGPPHQPPPPPNMRGPPMQNMRGMPPHFDRRGPPPPHFRGPPAWDRRMDHGRNRRY